MAHTDPRDSPVAPNGIGDGIERVADDAPHGAHSEIGQAGHDGLRYVHFVSSSVRTRTVPPGAKGVVEGVVDCAEDRGGTEMPAA